MPQSKQLISQAARPNSRVGPQRSAHGIAARGLGVWLAQRGCRTRRNNMFHTYGLFKVSSAFLGRLNI